MELRHLRYFVAVAEELHFRRAAERLHISQPPLSLQIADLERELGAKLFERTSQRVSLTDAGRVFLERTREILALVKQARREVQLASEGLTGELRIGFTQSLELLDILPEAVRRHRRQHPGISFALQQMPSAEQVAAVGRRDLDVGITRQPRGATPRDIEVLPLHDDPLVLAVHQDHPLAARGSVAAADLRGLPLVIQPADSGSGLRELTLAMWRRARLVPAIVQEAREIPTILGLVAVQVGVAVVPASSRRIGIDSIRLLPIADHAAQTALLLCVHRGHASPAVNSFAATLLEVAAAPASVGD